MTGHADRAQEPAWPKPDCKLRATTDVHRFLPIGVNKGEGAALPDEFQSVCGEGMRSEAVAVGLQVTCDRCIEGKQDICLHSEYLFPSLFIKKGKVLTLE